MSQCDTPSARSKLAAVSAFHAAAYALASSGLYRNATTVAIALERQGVDCALQFVGADFLFEAQLNELCRQHYVGTTDTAQGQSSNIRCNDLACACPLAETGLCSSVECPVFTCANEDLLEITDSAG